MWQNMVAFDYIKYESATLLANVYEQQNHTNLAKPSTNLAAFYVQGLQRFFQARYNEAKCVTKSIF